MTTDADDANSLPTDAPAPSADDAPPQDPPAVDDAPADPPADAPSDGGEPEDDDDDSQPQSRAQRRIRETLAERNAAMEYGEYWREKALELMRATGQAPAAESKPAQPKAPPKLDDFDSTEQWAAAYQQHVREVTAEEARAAARQELQSDRELAAQEQAQAQWGQRMAEFAKDHPDAQAVIGNPRLPITKEMSAVITASDHGPQLAYHLGTNPAEAARIARMGPSKGMSPDQRAAAIARQAAALGRLEVQLSSKPPAPKPPARKPSSAPEPPSPIDGGGTPSVDLESCSLNEFLERRLGKRRRA